MLSAGLAVLSAVLTPLNKGRSDSNHDSADHVLSPLCVAGLGRLSGRGAHRECQRKVQLVALSSFAAKTNQTFTFVHLSRASYVALINLRGCSICVLPLSAIFDNIRYGRCPVIKQVYRRVYRSRYDKPSLAARCCPVANDTFTNFTGDRRTNGQKDIAITQSTRFKPAGHY